MQRSSSLHALLPEPHLSPTVFAQTRQQPQGSKTVPLGHSSSDATVQELDSHEQLGASACALHRKNNSKDAASFMAVENLLFMVSCCADIDVVFLEEFDGRYGARAFADIYTR